MLLVSIEVSGDPEHGGSVQAVGKKIGKGTEGDRCNEIGIGGLLIP
jgi:hypothetical protein